ncbi:MAG: LacI family transcriptional regulator [Brooklawnia sp.]|nr:LacI family transcriptional regulator [Brooklawnia sp.]
MTARPPRVGIKDVALLAGVSVGTVSHVLNRPERVSARRRAAVENAIEELGYVPNHAARQLKVGRSAMVGYLYPNPTNPYFANLGVGISQEAERRDLYIFIAHSQGDLARRRHYLSLFEQQRVRGIIVAPKSLDVSTEQAISRRGTPVVLASTHDPTGRLCSVAADDLTSGRLAGEHLATTGRRKIMVVAPVGQTSPIRRWRGAQQVAQEFRVEATLVQVEGTSITAGCRVAGTILDLPADERPDALFCTSDMLAIGAVQVLVRDGRLRVPHDIAVIGCDDLEFSSSAIIPLSSIQQHEVRMGEIALELLEDESSNPNHVHTNVLLEPVLVARASTLG